MARSNSTLDRAVLRELAGTQDGGWALGGTLEAFSQGKTAAYAKTEDERLEALQEGTRRAKVAQQARESTGVLDAATAFSEMNLAGYRLDAPENRVRVDKNGLSVEIDSSDPHAAEEVNHARTMDKDAPSSYGGYSTSYFVNQRDEMLSAMGGITPWAFSKEGGGHNLYGADVKAFWSDMMGRWKEHGGDSDAFIRTLDVPDNSRQVIKAYLDNLPGAREKLENAETWNLVASNARPHEDMAAAKGGEDRFVNGRNFLATDEVPDTIFGIPVAKAEGEWTEEDLRFFREHPEAGGYYTMGDEAPEEQGAVLGGTSRGDYPGAWNSPGNVRYDPGVVREGTVGRVGKDNGFLKFDTPQHGLNAMADVIRRIANKTIQERFDEGTLPDNRVNVSNIVSVYAPSKENNTNDYIRFVSGRMGVPADQPIDLSNEAVSAKLLDSMIRRDSGHPHADWFTKEEYRHAARRMGGKK